MTELPVDKSPERIRRMFGAIAPRYDLINRLLTLNIDSVWRKRTATILLDGNTLSGDVLDVCCGTGELTLALYRHRIKQGVLTQDGQAADRMTLVGIDFSPEMIEAAKKKFGRKRLEIPYQFTVADALDLPFESNKFALVAVAFGLRNLVDMQNGLAEMVRVCKQGGMVAVLDFSMPTVPVLKQCYQFYFQILLPRLGQWLGKNQDRAYHYLPESVLQFDKPEQIASRLRQLGIGNIQSKPMTFGIATLIWGQKMS